MATYSEKLRKGLKMVSKPPVIEYHKSFGGPGNWNLERSVAEEVQQKIERLNLPLALNHLTSGDGSCLMIAIQQCLQHEDVIPHISKEVLMKARSYNTNWLRNSVSQFALNSQHPKVQRMKDFYIRTEYRFQSRKVSWEELWSDSPHGMKHSHKWGDQNFLQAAAYFLHIKIKVLDTSENNNQYTIYPGNLDSDPQGPPIYLGLRNGCHFQALIPVGTSSEIEPDAPNEVIDLENEDSRDSFQDETKDLDNSDDSMRDETEEILKEAALFQEDKPSDSDVSMVDKSTESMKDEKMDDSLLEDSEDEKVKENIKEETIELPTSCPVCRKPYKQVLCHIKSKEHCKKNIHPDELKRLENIRDNNKRIKNRERKARNRKLNPEKAKEQMRKQRELNPDKAKE